MQRKGAIRAGKGGRFCFRLQGRVGALEWPAWTGARVPARTQSPFSCIPDLLSLLVWTSLFQIPIRMMAQILTNSSKENWQATNQYSFQTNHVRKKIEGSLENVVCLQCWVKLTRASSNVEKGNAYSAAPGTRSSLASAPRARTSLAVQLSTI